MKPRYQKLKDAIIKDGRFLRENDDERLEQWFWAGVAAVVQIEGNDGLRDAWLLKTTLQAVLTAWKHDADQGDGIMESDFRLYNRAMKLVNPNYEPE